jgi:hypothetical protein
MKLLRSQQLDYITPLDFIKQQLTVNGIALFVWLIGLGFLLFSKRLRSFQFLAFAYILVFIFLLKMNGKDYYLFGAYPMLFAAGGYGFERWIKARGYAFRTAVVVLFTLPDLLLFPLVLPIFSINQTLAWFKIMHISPTWEDRKTHPLTQDYADMFGWNEITEKVAQAYNSLTPEQQKHTQIYADNYGEAGAIHHLGKRYNLPDAASLNSSFTLWAPDDLNAQYIIYVDDNDGDNVKKFAPYLESYTKIGEVTSPYAREKGTGIFLLVNPHPAVLNDTYRKELALKRLE